MIFYVEFLKFEKSLFYLIFKKFLTFKNGIFIKSYSAMAFHKKLEKYNIILVTYFGKIIITCYNFFDERYGMDC